MSQHPVYIMVWPSPHFPAHWATWLPAYTADPEHVYEIGKLIHVKGDSSEGFRHEFLRNYNWELRSSRPTKHFIGWTASENVLDGANSGPVHEDATATDTIGEWALYVAAPGPSLRPAQSSARRTKVSMENCQTWIRQFIETLIQNGILGQEALSALDQGLKN